MLLDCLSAGMAGIAGNAAGAGTDRDGIRTDCDRMRQTEPVPVVAQGQADRPCAACVASAGVLRCAVCCQFSPVPVLLCGCCVDPDKQSSTNPESSALTVVLLAAAYARNAFAVSSFSRVPIVTKCSLSYLSLALFWASVFKIFSSNQHNINSI